MSDDWGSSAGANLSTKDDLNDEWGATADTNSKDKTSNFNDDWGVSASANTTNKTTNSTDDWGVSASKNSSDNKSNPFDEWGDSVTGSSSKTPSKPNDNWGASTSRNSNNRPPRSNDGWGASTGGNSNNRPPRSNDGWGASTGGNSNNRPPRSNDSWGAPTGRNFNPSGRNFNNRPPRSNDSWGSTAVGDSNKRPFESDDGWGSSGKTSSKVDVADSNDNWGATADTASSGDWGAATGSNDDWGAPAGESSAQTAHKSRGTPTKSSNRFADSNDGWGDTSKGWSNGNEDDKMKSLDANGGGEEAEKRAPYKPEQLNLDEEAELQSADVGENFQRYRDQKVTCLPPGAVEPVEKFEDVIASQLLLDNLKKLKYTEMTPIQKWAMPAIVSGYDIIGCAQTGSGKTAAFLLPILQTIMKLEMEPHDPNNDCQSPYCLIISPTRELARQIYTNAGLLSRDSIVKCRVIYGQVATFHLKAQMSEGCHILVATLGRLKDFLGRGWIDFKKIKWIILDEGDRLVDERSGTDLRDIMEHPTMPPKEERQTLFFSATFKDGGQENAREFLKDPFIFLAVGRVGAANEDIKQEFMKVERNEKKRELRKILSGVPLEEKTIIFTQTKHTADILSSFLTSLNLDSTSIHGDRHQSQREEAISLFKRGLRRFLISSPVGNRGLDLPKVALVINYDLPENIDEYVHRIGRTGRAGHTGRAISFYDAERNKELLPDLLKILKEAKQEIPKWLEEEANPSTDFSIADSGEKRQAEDDAGNDTKKHDPGEQPDTANDDWW